MKYAKSRKHSTTTIHPDPTLWKHQPDPVIIEQCHMIAEYPLIAKSFAPKDEDINYTDIQKFKELFIGYDDAVWNYLDQRSPEHLQLYYLVDARVKNRDDMSDDFKQLIQFFYEVQCALTEFYVLVGRYQYQFRKTMLTLLQEDSKKAFKPYLHDDMKKKSGSKAAYTTENAELLGSVYELYVRVGSGLKVMWEYTFSPEKSVLRQDVEVFWLLGGYIFEAYDLHYKALELKTKSIYKDEYLQQDDCYMTILEQLDILFTSASGEFTRELAEGGATQVELDKILKVHAEKSAELKALYEQGYPRMDRLGGNAVIKLTSNLLNPRLFPDHIFSYEISLYTNSGLTNVGVMKNLVAELIAFGGIYNQARDCVVYPLVLEVPPNLDPYKLTNYLHDQFNEYTRAFLHTLMVNYPYIYFFDQEYALENQLKVRMDAVAYS